MARRAVKGLTITEPKIKSSKIYIVVSGGKPTMSFWNKAEAERVMALTLRNFPPSYPSRPTLHECDLY